MVRQRAVAFLTLAAAAGCLSALSELPLTPCDVNGGCPPGLVCGKDLFCQLADAGVDAGKPRDAGVDAGFDAGVDAGLDAGPDAGFDGGADAGPDAGPQDAGCVPPVAAPGGITPRAWFGFAADATNILLAGGQGACSGLKSAVVFGTANSPRPSEDDESVALTVPTIGLAGGFVPGSSPPPPSPQLFLFGGVANGTGSDDSVEIDPYTNLGPGSGFAPLPLPLAWLASTPLPVQAPAPGGGTQTDVLFVLVGGEGPSDGPSGALLVFDPLGTTLPKQGHWYQPDSGLPNPRSHLGAAIGLDGLLYAMGGQDGSGAPLGPVDTFNVSTGCLNSVGVLDGGVLDSGYNGATCGWSTLSAGLPTPRTDLAVTTGPDGLIYAIGGVTAAGVVTGLVEAYNPADGGWITPPALNIARHGHGAATTSDGRIWVLGGVDADGGLMGTVEAYDPADGGGWLLGGQ